MEYFICVLLWLFCNVLRSFAAKQMSLLLQYHSAGNYNNHPKASRKYKNVSTQKP